MRRLRELSSVLVWAFVSTVYAAPQTISGLDFEVSEVVDLDANLVKVTVLGKSTVIARDKLDDFVVEETLKKSAQQFSSDELRRLIQKSLLDGHTARAVGAFPFYLARLSQQPADQQTRQFWGFFEQVRGAKAIADFWQAFDIDKAFAQLAPAAREAARLERALVFRAVSKSVLLVLDDSSRALFLTTAQQEFDAAIVARKIERARSIKDLLQEQAAAENRVLSAMALAISRVETLEGSLESHTAERQLPVVDACLAEGQKLEMYKPYIFEVVHQAASDALKENRVLDAIDALSRLEPGWRTPQTHNLARISLMSLPSAALSQLRGARIQLLFEAIARNDTEFLSNYISSLEKGIVFSIEGKDIRTAEDLFSVLLRLRIDPSVENDELRQKLARAYSELGMRDRAERILAECKTDIAWSTRMSLLLQRLTDGTWIWYEIFLALVLAALLAFATRARALFAGVRERQKEKLEEERIQAQARLFERGYEEVKSSSTTSSASSEPPPFRARSGSYARKEQREEYYDCLRALRLGKEADTAAIKSAYRALVKEVHPDRQDQSQDAQQKFVNLREKYQRALALRKELGLE